MWWFNGAFAALGLMDIIPSREGRVAFAIVICNVDTSMRLIANRLLHLAVRGGDRGFGIRCSYSLVRI